MPICSKIRFVNQRNHLCRCGGIGRRTGLKILRLNKPCRFDSGHLHHKSIKEFERINLDAFIIKLLEFSNKFLTIWNIF